MRFGDVMRTRNIRHYDNVGGWLEYKAPKGKVFVFVMLGVEPHKHDGSEDLDLQKAIENLGYEAIAEVQREESGVTADNDL